MVDVSMFLEIWKSHGWPGLLSVIGLAISVSVFTSVSIAGLIDYARKKEVGSNLVKILLASFALVAVSACTTYYFVVIPEGQEQTDGPHSRALDKAEDLLVGSWAIEGMSCSDAVLFEIDRAGHALILSTDDGIHTSYAISSVRGSTVRVSYGSGEEIAFIRQDRRIEEASSLGQSRSYKLCDN